LGGEEDYFDVIIRAFIATYQLPARKIGEAVSYRFSAAQLCDYGQQWMETHFSRIG